MLHVEIQIETIHDPRGFVHRIGRHPAYLEAVNPAHDISVRRDSLPDEYSDLRFHVSSGLELIKCREAASRGDLGYRMSVAEFRHVDICTLPVHHPTRMDLSGSEKEVVLNDKPTVDEKHKLTKQIPMRNTGVKVCGPYLLKVLASISQRHLKRPLRIPPASSWLDRPRRFPRLRVCLKCAAIVATEASAKAPLPHLLAEIHDIAYNASPLPRRCPVVVATLRGSTGRRRRGGGRHRGWASALRRLFFSFGGVAGKAAEVGLSLSSKCCSEHTRVAPLGIHARRVVGVGWIKTVQVCSAVFALFSTLILLCSRTVHGSTTTYKYLFRFNGNLLLSAAAEVK